MSGRVTWVRRSMPCNSLQLETQHREDIQHAGEQMQLFEQAVLGVEDALREPVPALGQTGGVARVDLVLVRQELSVVQRVAYGGGPLRANRFSRLAFPVRRAQTNASSQYRVEGTVVLSPPRAGRRSPR